MKNNKISLETLKMRGGGGLKRIKKVLAPLLIALLLISTFFAGQILTLGKSYATESLPDEGTISLTSAVEKEYIVAEDGDLQGKLTGAAGGTGGGGSYNVWLGGSNHEYRYTDGGLGGKGGSVTYNTKIKKGQIVKVIPLPGSSSGEYGAGGAGGGGTPGGRGNGDSKRGGGNGGAGVKITINGVDIAAAHGGGGGGKGGDYAGGNGGAGQNGQGYGGQITSDSTVWSATLSTKKRELTVSDSYEGINKIANSFEETVEILKSIVSGGAIGGGHPPLVPDKIVVISGKPFSEYIKGNEETTGGTVEGITVINNDVTDGYVRVSGTLSKPSTGYEKEIVIDKIKYVFKIVEEPDSTNVKVILN